LLIRDHLDDAYPFFSESVEEASQYAQARIEQIINSAVQFVLASLRGDSHDDLLLGLRRQDVDPPAYWFRVRPEQHEIQLQAVISGGQDHQRYMFVRLLQNSSEATGSLL